MFSTHIPFPESDAEDKRDFLLLCINTMFARGCVSFAASTLRAVVVFSGKTEAVEYITIGPINLRDMTEQIRFGAFTYTLRRRK